MFEQLLELKKEISQIDHSLWVLSQQIDDLIDAELFKKENKLLKNFTQNILN